MLPITHWLLRKWNKSMKGCVRAYDSTASPTALELTPCAGVRWDCVFAATTTNAGYAVTTQCVGGGGCGSKRGLDAQEAQKTDVGGR